MANIERWKPNKEVDPKYPYHCRWNDDGRIVYSVPMEAPNDIPADMNDEGADKYEYSYLPLLGGKSLRVYCWETTDREWAYRIRSMINTAHTQERRYAERFTDVPEIMGDGINDGNRKTNCMANDESEEQTEYIPEISGRDPGKPNGYEPHEWPEVEKQVLDRIDISAVRDLAKNKDPRSWEIFCRIRLHGADAKELAEELGISIQRVYQLADKIPEIAKRYRKENS